MEYTTRPKSYEQSIKEKVEIFFKVLTGGIYIVEKDRHDVFGEGAFVTTEELVKVLNTSAMTIGIYTGRGIKVVTNNEDELNSIAGNESDMYLERSRGIDYM
ncbi:hypothetical protein CIL05_07410 [Virgibacillus profundi]|uniref:Uncharacterized protein n=1 Tax=Virgibacillus profundi TaxID=2024555 RepID=A0A2A2IFZ4_9BACI|nr:hypothetical protein [Virgibacillus profundi]PAV30288.1 hypothetical protein CIL05_07410 [Virgibacillus profundi]PXY54460.1 hypothetical protein CIT14_07495 [Virgibacillus profundi]